MANVLYTIIIYPLVQIIEFVYNVVYKIFWNMSFSIVCVSLAVSFLCLPLYIIAEKWQNMERETIRNLKPKIDKIKNAFRGDEQYMILSTYYRQNHYHPVYALRNSFGILIQIPFFIAAYSFLSHLETLKGVSFLFIQDLSRPDGLFTINENIHINILPVIMTLINCVSGTIYTKSLYLRDKIQVYGMAAVFLILLYNSPAGLVFYWTVNNIFSLAKNVFIKMKNPLKVLYVLFCISAFFADIYLLFFHLGDITNRIILVFTSLAIFLSPLFPRFGNFIFRTVLAPLLEDRVNRTLLFFLSLGIICLSAGFVIPSYIINSSPQEFSYIETITSPFYFLGTVFLQAFGFSILWPLCIYFLFGGKTKTVLSFLAILAAWCALINTFVFSGKYGDLSAMLTFSNAGIIKPSTLQALVNIAALIACAVILVVLVRINRLKIIAAASVVVIFSLAGISVVHSIGIGSEFSRLTAIRESSNFENDGGGGGI